MIFALDFDRTLFMTDAHTRALREVKRDAPIGTPQVLDVVDVRPFLYDDVRSFFDATHGSKKYIVSAVTWYGPTSEQYQEEKIRRSGVTALVDGVLLTNDSKIAALTELSMRFPDEILVFVDDLVDHLVAVQAVLPRVHCIHMSRDGAEQKSTVAVPEHMITVHTLTELLHVVSAVAL